MTMPTRVDKAERAINEMPFGVWISVGALAKSARLSVQTMTRFLIRAKKAGLVDNKKVVIHSIRVCL
jgi:hypothetical protein